MHRPRDRLLEQRQQLPGLERLLEEPIAPAGRAGASRRFASPR
jgi:hypothetical protein